MRRAITIVLLFAMGMPLGLLFAQTAEANSLPVCCRRGGAHHCMAAPSESPTSALKISAKNQPCPYRTFVQQQRSDQDAPAAAGQDRVPLLSYSRAFVQAVIDYVVSDGRTHHKRGPPSFLS